MQVHWTLHSNLGYFMQGNLSTVPVSQHIYAHSILKVVNEALLRRYPEVVASYPVSEERQLLPCLLVCTPYLLLFSVWHVIRDCTLQVWCMGYLFPSTPHVEHCPPQVPGSVALYGRSCWNAPTVRFPSFHTRSHCCSRRCVLWLPGLTWLVGDLAMRKVFHFPSVRVFVCPLSRWPE